MTTLQDAVKGQLEGYIPLSVLAEGGIHDDESAGRDGMRRELLMVAGEVAIRPGIYIHWPSDVPFGEHQATLGVRRVFCEIYFYQDNGYTTVREMRRLVRGLLEYGRVTFDDPPGQFNHDILWRGDVTGQYDDAMKCSMERTRFELLVSPTG